MSRILAPAILAFAIGFAAFAASAQAATVLKHEPGEGMLALGQRVLVDDGSCPPGQIKEVTSGNNRVIGTTQPKHGMQRVRKCVKR